MIPKCCGKKMKLKNEGMRFAEAVCEKCGYIIYIKRPEEYSPQLIYD